MLIGLVGVKSGGESTKYILLGRVKSIAGFQDSGPLESILR